MIVCSCNQISDRDIRAVLADGLPPTTSAAKVYRAVGCRAKCGRCADTIRAILSECPAACCAPAAIPTTAIAELDAA